MGSEKQTKIPVTSFEERRFPLIRYSGIYDFHHLLTSLRSWLNSHYYVLVDAEHTESVKPQGKEIKVIMIPFKNVTPYVRYTMEIEIEILRELDVLVKDDTGRSVQKQRGDMDFRVKATLVKNYKKTFPSTTMGEFFRQLYEKYIAKQHLKHHSEKLLEETQEFIDAGKDVLNSFKRRHERVITVTQHARA